MTQKELTELGFKKKEYSNEYWFELKCRKHIFITNDSTFNKRKDKWHIGYYTRKEMEDIFWFNNNLNNTAHFTLIFHILTGIGFKLAHQRKLIK